MITPGKGISSPARRAAVAALAGICIGLALLPMLGRGIDITDHGFVLTSQRGYFAGDPAYRTSLTWLSRLIGGAWLALLGDPGLYGARLGYVLTIALTAAVAGAILSGRFGFRQTLLAVGLAALVSIRFRYRTIDYNCLPLLFLMAAGGLSLAALPRHVGPRRQALYSLGAGVLYALAMLARFPLILALAVPWLLGLSRAWADRARWKPALRASLLTMAGVFLGVGLGLVWLAVNDRLEGYPSVFFSRSGPSSSHSTGTLLSVYLRDLRLLLEHGLIFVCPLGLGALLLARRAPRSRWPVLLFAAVALAVFAYAGHGLSFYVLFGSAVSTLSGLLVLAAGLCFVVAGRGREAVPALPARDRELILLAMLVPPLTMAGSDNGFPLMQHALWLCVPVVLAYLPRTVAALLPAGFVRVEALRPYLAVVAGGVACLCLAAYVFSPYRDLADPTALTFAFDHPRLAGITTSETRRDALDELFVEVERRTQPGDRIITFNGLPLVYYVTRTWPVRGVSWWMIGDPEKIEADFEELAREQRFPLIALSLTRTRDWDWPSSEERALPRRERAQLAVLERFVRTHGYRVVWSNACFRILERAR